MVFSSGRSSNPQLVENLWSELPISAPHSQLLNKNRHFVTSQSSRQLTAECSGNSASNPCRLDSIHLNLWTGTYISVLELVFLYWDIYFCSGIYIFCTGIYIFLYWNIHISVLEYIFLYWNIHFCTGIHIFVLEPIFLYWNLYFCTGTDSFVLEYIFLYWNLYFCTGIYIFVLELIFLYCPCGPP